METTSKVIEIRVNATLVHDSDFGYSDSVVCKNSIDHKLRGRLSSWVPKSKRPKIMQFRGGCGSRLPPRNARLFSP